MFVPMEIAMIWEGVILQSQTEKVNEVSWELQGKEKKKELTLPEYFKGICFLVLFQISERMKTLLSNVPLREKNGSLPCPSVPGEGQILTQWAGGGRGWLKQTLCLT